MTLLAHLINYAMTYNLTYYMYIYTLCCICVYLSIYLSTYLSLSLYIYIHIYDMLLYILPFPTVHLSTRRAPVPGQAGRGRPVRVPLPRASGARRDL